MSPATVIIAALLVGLFALAIRYLIKNGSCAGCSEKDACHATKNASSGASASGSGCSGKCASCQYYEAELQAAAKHRADV